ncbi:exosome complex component RRP41 [Nematocida minor]|uniref:exosome complex component RRP41 n=1 Tax=Nematocida minor TaxID=1912983 RepID=UPI00221E3C06|nr:exosome complex component RRP41 [Nematocida minor]KAI5191623.1 exosome complex component RRP41 [Nematocida minor]
MGYIDCEYNAIGRDKAGVIVTNEGSKILAVLNGPFEPTGSIINVHEGTVRVTIAGAGARRTEYAAHQESIEKTLSEIIYLRDYPRSILDIRVFVMLSADNVFTAILNSISMLLMNAGIQMKGVLLSVYMDKCRSTAGYVYSNKKYQKLLQIGTNEEESSANLLDDLLERMLFSLKEDYKRDWMLI